MEVVNRSLLKCRVARQWYGLDLTHIVEILWFVYLEELPSTRPEVIGLLTLRDQTMPVLDLRLLFDVPDQPLTLFTPIIALTISGQHVAVVVDEALDVLTVKPEQLQPNDESPYIGSVIHTTEHLIRVINVDRLLRNTTQV